MPTRQTPAGFPLRCALTAVLAACAASGVLAQGLAPPTEALSLPLTVTPAPEFPAPEAAPLPDEPSLLPGFITGKGILDAPEPDLVMTIRAGIRFSPAYMGAAENKPGPDAGLRFDYIKFPNGFAIGSNNTVGFQTGFGPRLSGRYIRARNSDDYSEIRGLDDIPFTFETGIGFGYEQRNYRAFADVRYGVLGHHAWVGDLGADGIAYPLEGLTLTLGPRLNFGTNNFVDTYFGISNSESQASDLPPYDPNGGLYGAGLQLGARYLFNERWGVEGVATYTRLMNDAANSPITEDGSANQYRLRLDITRRISLDF